jgi:hypothetical protein
MMALPTTFSAVLVSVLAVASLMSVSVLAAMSCRTHW